MTSADTAISIPAIVVPRPPLPPCTVLHGCKCETPASPSTIALTLRSPPAWKCHTCTANPLTGTSSLKIRHGIEAHIESWTPETPNQHCQLHLETRFLQITVKFKEGSDSALLYVVIIFHRLQNLGLPGLGKAHLHTLLWENDALQIRAPVLGKHPACCTQFWYLEPGGCSFPSTAASLPYPAAHPLNFHYSPPHPRRMQSHGPARGLSPGPREMHLGGWMLELLLSVSALTPSICTPPSLGLPA